MSDYFSRRTDEEIFNTPQKRFIRREVWSYYAIRRKDKGHLRFIRYLTFPAVGCYDVKILKELNLIDTIDIDGVTKYRSVGFCEKDDEKFALIQEKLPGARYYKGRYEELVGAYGEVIPDRVLKWFPFDVINLDFTSPLFSSEKKKVTKAIKRTFEIQKIMYNSFTLFLTLPARGDGDLEDGKEKLNENLKNNLINLDMIEFRQKFLEEFPEMDINKKIYNQMDYVDFLLISIPKMIVGMGTEDMFDVKCNERFSYIGDHYDGKGGNKTLMVKFVFECEFVGRKDGVTGKNPIYFLSKEYPKNILSFFTQSPININQMFESKKEIKSQYCNLEY
ncbi:MAG: hypothetical protein WC568_01120 [Candidatus Methanoperedens sp.]